MCAALPENEKKRLAVLNSYSILDTLPEQDFEDIVMLASEICDTPISLVSLVDNDRQWFKARVGLEAQETPREVSFCAHAILEPDQILVVPDTMKDERFRENDLVTGGPKIRFYAGAPLVMQDGSALGTLCIIDSKPRKITQKQLKALNALRNSVVNALELRRLYAEASTQRSILYSILSDLSAETDTDGIMQKAVQAMARLNRWESIGIAALSADGQFWQTCADLIMPSDQLSKLRPLNQGVIGRAFRSGEMQIVLDTSADPDFFIPAGEQGFKSELVIPIKYEGRVTCAVNLESSKVEAFSKNDIEFAASVAEVISLALGNAYKFDLLKQEIELRKQSEEQYQHLLEHVNIAVYDSNVGMDGKWSYVSPNIEKISGIPAGEWMENSQLWLNLIHPEDVEMLLENEKKMLSADINSSTTEYRLCRRDGSIIWVRDENSKIFDPVLGNHHLVGYIQDITEGKHFEHGLAESEERYRLLVENSHDLIQSIAPDGKILFVNNTWRNALGYTPEDIKRMTIFDIIKPEELPHCKNLFAQVLQGEYFEDVEVTFIAQNGEHILCNGIASPIELNGKVVASHTSFRDVTNQRRVETSLKLSEQRFRRLFETGPVMNLIVESRDGVPVIADCNEQFIYTIGYTAAEIIGRPLEFIYTESSRLKINDGFLRAQTELVADERELVTKEGRVISTLFHAVANYNAQGTVSGTFAAYIDISDRKSAEQSLRQREQQLQSLVTSQTNYVVRTDMEGNYTYWNDKFREDFGWIHPNDIRGALALNTINEYHHQRANETVLACIAEPGKVVKVELDKPTRDGSRRTSLWEFICLTDENGAPFNIQCIGVDISDRKIAENARLASEENYRNLVENSESQIAVIDSAGIVLYSNPKGIEIWNDPHIVGKSLFDLYPKRIAKNYLNNIQQVIGSQKGLVSEVRIPIAGRAIWFRLSLQPLRSSEDVIDRVLLSALDITLEKESKHILEENEKLLSLILDTALDAVIMINDLGRVTSWNPAAEVMFGWSQAEAIGSNLSDLIIPSHMHNAHHQGMKHFMETGEGPILNRRVEITAQRKNGEAFPAELTIRPLKVGNKFLFGGFIRDITERKATEFDLIESKEKYRKLSEELEQRVQERTHALQETQDDLSSANIALEKSARHKDQFLASMSHELRTPLTGILGLSEALQLKTYGDLSEKQLKTLKHIEESGYHLLDLINDILDLSKIEAGMLDLQITRCSVEDICKASLQLTKGMAQHKKQMVMYSQPSAPVMVQADARRLKQIIVNLLSNAIKFTPDNGELGLEVQTDVVAEKINITVWDKGIGIKTQNIKNLFQPFTQIDASLAREYSGTGLGLSLVARLVELHHGDIKVESTFGEGSRFTVSLPMMLEENSSAVEESGDHNQPNTWGSTKNKNDALVLIADDNDVILDMLHNFLESQSYRVIKAHSGAELLESASKFHPDIMLVDIQMPGMDGLEAIRRIRSHTDPVVAATYVIAVTALAMSNDRERCLEAGANEYMSKPVRLAELADLIQVQIGKNK